MIEQSPARTFAEQLRDCAAELGLDLGAAEEAEPPPAAASAGPPTTRPDAAPIGAELERSS